MINLNQYANAQQQIEAIAALLSKQIQAINGRCVIAVSGGNSPIALYNYLSNLDLPWHNIALTLVDERIVATTDSASNAYLVQRHLLQNKAKDATFIPLDSSITQFTAQQQPIDIALLGMGEDGHTASIFADCAEFNLALTSEQQYTNTNPQQAPYSRISLTLTGLANIKCLILSISGAKKLSVFKQALQQADRLAQADDYPITSLLRRRHDLHCYWSN